MALVVDASALLAVILNEPEKPAIIEATKNTDLLTPEIIPFEIGNALSRLRRRHLLDADEVIRCYELFERLGMPTVRADVRRALVVANTYAIYAYDACYLEAAFRLRLPLLTLDKRMKSCAEDMGLEIAEVYHDGV